MIRRGVRQGEVKREVKTEGIHEKLLQLAILNPHLAIRELNNRSLYHFLQYFWGVVSTQDFKPNWHIEFVCQELEKIAERVAKRLPREHDLIINIPPGSTKTITCSIMFPVWCWTKWPWMRFITASYSGALALESADVCRDLINSPQFQTIYPDIAIREDKNTKSNFKIVKSKLDDLGRVVGYEWGGSRYSTSVGGTLTGFHGDILIVDDPINPQQAVSELELNNANRWMEQTLPTRKTDKAVSTMILIMQRLHQNDPTGHLLSKNKGNIKHICIPGEIRTYAHVVKPPELVQHYEDDLMDPVRLNWKVLEDLMKDLGQYGYAGQIGQEPTPPGGGMFKVNQFVLIDNISDVPPIVKSVRYWDKAGTEGANAWTVGVRMHLLKNDKWLIDDVVRGRWSSERRENIILNTALQDGYGVTVWMEQEPGSGGKESAENTIRNLAGFSAYAERTTGDKVTRADPYSVQVNNGNVYLLKAGWTEAFIEEHRYFPYGTYKDQVDASSGAFSKLIPKRTVRRIS